jgi:hypothetical protein
MLAVTDEKRRFSRISFDATVLLSKDNNEWRTSIQDISLNGLLVNTPDKWDATQGERFHAEVLFADNGPVISADVTVAHKEEGKVGFKVVNIDVESVSHLRRLVELNLGDEELLNRELATLHWK